MGSLSMPWRLRAKLYWCDCGGRAIFLDVEEDLYFCLSASANAAFLRLSSGTMQPEDRKLLRSLIDRGLLIEGEGSLLAEHRCFPEPPTADFLSTSSGTPGPLDLVRALASEWAVARLVRAKPFAHILEAASSSRPTKRYDVNAIQSARAIASASHIVSFLAGSTDRCLVRALAVHRQCRTAGIAAELVFGVRINPFAAHCWVQLGSAVLVGEFEQVRLYTPILALK